MLWPPLRTCQILHGAICALGYGAGMTRQNHNARGLPYAVGAYGIWGLLPVYLMLVKTVPPFEFVSWRILFTVPVCLLLSALRGQFGVIWQVLRTPRAVAALALSAVVIGGNWLIYIYAIIEDHVYAASLGYYINPLLNILAGTLFLGERLSRRQWVAVALAGAGVAILFAGALSTLWISLSLALTFSIYGLVRKLVAVGPLPGLTVETLLLACPALAMIGWLVESPQGTTFGQGLPLSALVSLSGVLTAVPLLMFAVAARRMDYSALGFVQFLSPTLVFIVGLTVFDTPLQPVQLASFVLIWCAIGVFCWDLLSRRSEAAPPA
jgi:chloramphenicol-sensitive protein RarD